MATLTALPAHVDGHSPTVGGSTSGLRSSSRLKEKRGTRAHPRTSAAILLLNESTTSSPDAVAQAGETPNSQRASDCSSTTAIDSESTPQFVREVPANRIINNESLSLLQASSPGFPAGQIYGDSEPPFLPIGTVRSLCFAIASDI